MIAKKRFNTTTIEYQLISIKKDFIALRLSSPKGEDCSTLKMMILLIWLCFPPQRSRSRLKYVFDSEWKMMMLS